MIKKEKETRCWGDLAEGQMAVNQIPFLLMGGLIFAANFKFSWNGVSLSELVTQRWCTKVYFNRPIVGKQ